MKYVPKREINDAELSDKLRFYKRHEVEVPVLSSSIYLPVFREVKEDGTEIYQVGHDVVSVGPDEVIDSSGNVVNIEALEIKLNEKLSEIKDYKKN